MNYPFYKQLNVKDCGPTCLKIIAKYYGKYLRIEFLRKKMGLNKLGVSFLNIRNAAKEIGFDVQGYQINYTQLQSIDLPAILHWDHDHFVVLFSIKHRKITIADPSQGIISYSPEDFKVHWEQILNNNYSENLGFVLCISPTEFFFQLDNQKENKINWKLIIKYLSPRKMQLIEVIISLVIISIFQLIFPFLTQTIVDIGIDTKDIQFIFVILLAQLMLAMSQTFVSFFRSRMLLKISSTLNLQLLSDFWIKLNKIPLSFFDSRQSGDLLQRINDHKVVQDFLTNTALNTFFSIFTFIVYAVVVMTYDISIFATLILCSSIYFLWNFIFFKIRRKINYSSFSLSSNENNSTLQLIQGMQDIRLANAERQKRWEWEDIQASVFKLNIKKLNYSQIQSAGGNLINQTQNIIISFIIAQMVINNYLTLGGMLAIQYIIGQLSGPINQWVSFIQGLQDAQISLERLNEIHELPSEEDIDVNYVNRIPDNASLYLENISFAYPGMQKKVLDNINLTIENGKVTAIVGESGSGKTTLLKILLKVYDQYDGNIELGSILNRNEKCFGFYQIRHNYWRSIIGAVLQESYIFNDTIELNIAVGQNVRSINRKELYDSCRIANILSFIESLPKGFQTKLGLDGLNLSQGQKQRILIARAIYKNPKYLILDEATNSLDANNERVIVKALDTFFKGRTVIIVAHRLSTVIRADKIVVINNGCVVEEGKHDDLIQRKGEYYNLIKNQLELDN
ncbi:peptidase domain-containing ABC transporter [Rhizosphaericola mali]|uniref:Peptidase domain-containing ABC transporter n=1 Tax=Rhizosphaericola mali TaxID=2545455 RepID=A0A5P2G1B9_9BACT|nr:peptidase domain-containing ABC transporter [Rhizosphaericola mali]QES87630.1 peptidase domain-containing ABC transporter [Rhizosphaericola mali]